MRVHIFGSLLLTAALSAGASGQAEPAITTVRIATGLTQPLFITHAPGDSTRLFVVQRTGQIRILKSNGPGTLPTLLSTSFLDVSSLVQTGWLEYGLLGLAFHPDYAHNGYFYVNYTPAGATNADTHVVRYRVSSNPDVADPASASTVLRYTYTRREHRAGWMDFGPDGYLYILTGDGGESDPDNAAQTTAASSNLALRGKLLRLDVDGEDNIPGNADDDAFPSDPNKNYSIPPTNPFVIDPGNPPRAPEIYAYGLRNPWRASFDRLTGDLWIGDVGQNTREEVDRIPAGLTGLNFGWRCTEGTFCVGLSGCTCNGPTLTPPIYEYPHSTGLCVTGGYVYRGCAYPALRGTYIFADYQSNKAWSFRHVPGAPNNGVTAFTDRWSQIQPGGGFPVSGISSMGEDNDGELYLCAYSAGSIYKIVPPVGAPGASRDDNANGIPDACEFCPADVDNGTGQGTHDGAVDINDLVHCLGLIEQGSLRIDLDNGSGQGIPDNAVTIDDLLYFLHHFERGC